MKLFFLLTCVLLTENVFAQEVSDNSQKKRAFKVDFIAPLTGNLTLGYEQIVGNNISLDFHIGIIGVGYNLTENSEPRGVFIKAGPRLYISPNYEEKSKSYSPLQGTYINPTLSYSNWSSNKDIYTPSSGSNISYFDKTIRINSSSIAILLNLGHQFVFNKTICFNFYGGIGYGYTWFNNSYDSEGYEYSHAGASENVPIAVDAGIEIGIITK